MGHLGEFLTDFKGNTFRILMYHSISEEIRYPFAVTPGEFEWQMQWLHKQEICVLNLDEVLAGEGSKDKPRVVISFDDGYEDNFTTALPIMEKYGYKATFFITTGHVGESNVWEDVDMPRLKLMNWEQIKSLSGRGHIIGGHTHNHINLALADLSEVKRDLTDSKRVLAEKLNQDFVPLAYPFGQYTEDVVALAKEIGYSCGLTAGGFWGNNVNTSHWLLKREDINLNVNRRFFRAKIKGASDFCYIKLGFSYMLGVS